MDGTLLQTLEGLGEASKARTGGEIWEWLQGEKEQVAHELLSEGPLCQIGVAGVQEAEPSQESWRAIEWRHRGQLEARLREINDAQDRLMDGAYGRCIECGADIGLKRLTADPATCLCIDCRKDAEAEELFAESVSH